jgi:hypothetical protein
MVQITADEADGVTSGRRGLKRHDVVSVYRYLLDRSPTTDEIEASLSQPGLEQVRARIVASLEFAERAAAWRASHPLVVFLHIMKTGGRSFEASVESILGENLYWHRIVERQPIKRDVRRDFAASPTAFAYLPFVGGHFAYDAAEFSKIDRPVIYISNMRDSVSRAISLYNFAKSRPQNPMHKDLSTRTLYRALREVKRFRRGIFNAQLRSIFGSQWRYDDKTLRRHLETERLVVGKLEHLDRFITFVCGTLLGHPEIEIPRRNVASSGYQEDVRKQPDFAEAAALIAKENAAEIAFYESFGDLLVSPPAARWLEEHKAPGTP